MNLQSNLDYFNSRPRRDSEYQRRLQALENQCQQLRQYHIKAMPSKRIKIRLLLARYERAINKIYFKLDKRSI